MNAHKQQVHNFYETIWNLHDASEVNNVLHPDFTFRGSLGHENKGRGGFIGYVDMVHAALGEYRCIIDELVAAGDKVFARMTFTGVRNGHFMDYAPSKKRLSWSGYALVTFIDNKVSDLWALADLKFLELRLGNTAL
ncbi:MAG: ester cyclase [Gammaproteobacteria bacterium]|nr:ester cyclase [Gammaproteobacteria bacterium]MDH3466742.1 ester cyclase [Gammaproteobacteria bacterium]